MGERFVMITVPELAADALGTFLANYMHRRYGTSETRLVELVPSIARIAMECIGNSDALYHNVEHTMLVTLAGHDILRGRALHAHMPPEDYAHLILACVTHDIGYVRGIFLQDDENGFLVGAHGHKVKLPRGASDAALLPHHVDRSKLYIMERLQGVEQLDAARIARAVEGSRFPSSMPAEVERIDEEAALLRAADLIGQLGDPHYIRKANAISRIRGSGAEPPARLREPRRHRPQVSAVLLEQRGAPHPIRHSLSQRYGERPAMDCQSLFQCFSRRTRHCARRTPALTLHGRRRSVRPRKMGDFIYPLPNPPPQAGGGADAPVDVEQSATRPIFFFCSFGKQGQHWKAAEEFRRTHACRR
jgi:hypothetical protein